MGLLFDGYRILVLQNQKSYGADGGDVCTAM